MLALAAVLFVVEFIADKVPYLDSAWDAIHTFIRVPAGAILMVAAVADVDPALRLAAGVIGGSLALTTHSAKATARLAANTSPEPFSNVLLSTVEDMATVFLLGVAASHPVLAGLVLILVLGICVALLVHLLPIHSGVFREVEPLLEQSTNGIDFVKIRQTLASQTAWQREVLKTARVASHRGGRRALPAGACLYFMHLFCYCSGLISQGDGRMSGHSKWHSIKHKKGAADAKRGKIFTSIIKEITVAARIGGGDPDGNPRLRTIIDKAKSVNMPADNIKRAIQKGTGELPGQSYEDATYEGFGPSGVAVVVEAVTDNKNRTVSEIRHVFGKHGGNMGQTGSVAHLFSRKGLIVVEKSKVSEDTLMAVALDAGAEDMQGEGDAFRGLYLA